MVDAGISIRGEKKEQSQSSKQTRKKWKHNVNAENFCLLEDDTRSREN